MPYTAPPAVATTSTAVGGYKNLVHNGAMSICQRGNGSAGVAMTSASSTVYLVDRWSVVGTAGAWNYAQDTTAPPPGYSSSLKFTVSTTVASPLAAGSYWLIAQGIEGLNTYQLGYGTTSPKTVTLSFWAKATGVTTPFVMSGALRTWNGGSWRSFPFTYTLATPGVWQQISVVVPGDTVASIANDTTGQLNVIFTVAAGSTFYGTAGTWQTGNLLTTAAAGNFMASTGATLNITGVQLEVNTVATAFENRDYQVELAMCQRYFATIGGGASTAPMIGQGIANSNNVAFITGEMPVPMRSMPTGLVTSGSFTVSDRVSTWVVSAIAYNTLNPSTSLRLLDLTAVVTTATLTAKQPYMLWGSTTGAWVGASAEI